VYIVYIVLYILRYVPFYRGRAHTFWSNRFPCHYEVVCDKSSFSLYDNALQTWTASRIGQRFKNVEINLKLDFQMWIWSADYRCNSSPSCQAGFHSRPRASLHWLKTQGSQICQCLWRSQRSSNDSILQRHQLLSNYLSFQLSKFAAFLSLTAERIVLQLTLNEK